MKAKNTRAKQARQWRRYLNAVIDRLEDPESLELLYMLTQRLRQRAENRGAKPMIKLQQPQTAQGTQAGSYVMGYRRAIAQAAQVIDDEAKLLRIYKFIDRLMEAGEQEEENKHDEP